MRDRGQPGAGAAGRLLTEDAFIASFFVRLNNTGGPVDVWEVDGVDLDELVESGEGFCFLPRVVPSSQLRLVRQDVPPEDDAESPAAG